jgi:hypothetical protein
MKWMQYLGGIRTWLKPGIYCSNIFRVMGLVFPGFFLFGPEVEIHADGKGGREKQAKRWQGSHLGE